MKLHPEILKAAERLQTELDAGLRYGSVGVVFTVHDGQIRTVDYSRSEKLKVVADGRA